MSAAAAPHLGSAGASSHAAEPTGVHYVLLMNADGRYLAAAAPAAPAGPAALQAMTTAYYASDDAWNGDLGQSSTTCCSWEWAGKAY